LSITYPLSLPSQLRFATRDWTRINVAQDVPSPFTGQSQVVVYGGQWVEATLTLIALKRDEAQDWSAWLASLKGPGGTFLLGDPHRTVPLGAAASAPGTPLVKGAGQTGSTLLIDGCGATVTNYLKRGDLFQVTCDSVVRLHEVMADASSNGAGEVTLDIWPDLRASPADNAAIGLSAPKGTFHIPGQVPRWAVDSAGVSRISFDAKERLS